MYIMHACNEEEQVVEGNVDDHDYDYDYEADDDETTVIDNHITSIITINTNKTNRHVRLDGNSTKNKEDDTWPNMHMDTKLM